MGLKSEYTAIMGRFETQAAIDLPDLVYTSENVPFETPDVNTPWARVVILPGDSSPVSIGVSQRWRSFGVLVVQLFAAKEEGNAVLRELADTIAGWYRGRTIDGITYRGVNVRQVGSEGAWYQFNLEIPFQRDEIF